MGAGKPHHFADIVDEKKPRLYVVGIADPVDRDFHWFLHSLYLPQKG
jgi:hypothetical protein